MPIMHPLVADVVPFSYRDGDTYLEILSQYESAIEKCIADIEQLTEITNQYASTMAAIPLDIDSEVHKNFLALKKYVRDLFDELESKTVVTSPVWGRKGEIDKVLANMYNDLNTGAESAYYHDEVMGRTAAGADARNMTARRLDTAATGVNTGAQVDAPSNGRTGESDSPSEILGLE